MTPDPWLAEMALAEHASRVARYPALVEQGRLERTDAEADIAAWAAIAGLLEQGSCDAEPIEAIAGETSMPSAWWALLEHAAARALVSRSAAADAAPDDPARAEKRAAVHSIHLLLEGRARLARMRPTGLAEAA